jgi:alpha-beta hydrolase superfamily lysophospholipase
MMKDIYYPSHDGKTTIHACIWQPEGEVKGVVQIIHGMAEYAERYSPFADFLCANGYLVCAEDHLGHGKSIVDESALGYFSASRDIGVVLDDIHTLLVAVKKQTFGKPYYLLGHSMGSFICRKFISLYSDEVDGAVIMGSGYVDSFTTSFALSLVKLNALFFGWHHRSKFIKNLAFGSYNKKFKPVRTPNDWLSANVDNVDKYNSDSLCGFDFTNNGYNFLFTIIKEACREKTVEKVDANLPILFVAGEDDPVGNYSKGVVKSYNMYTQAGKNAQIKLYKNSRHEILNDDCKFSVFKDILDYFDNLSEQELAIAE